MKSYRWFSYILFFSPSQLQLSAFLARVFCIQAAGESHASCLNPFQM